MRVHEIDASCGLPRRASEREEEERERECEPRPSFEIAHDAVAVREPEVREGRRRDHLGVDASFPQVIHRVPDEDTGNVVRVARIGGRENENLHVRAAARPNTTGTATASTAKT